MTTLTAYGTITSGKLELINRRRFEQELREFKDCTVELSIKKKGKRSVPQLRYYWGVIVKEIQIKLRENEQYFTTDQVHDILKAGFNKKYLYGVGGEVIAEYGGSTAELNKDEFSVYLEKIRTWAQQYLQLYIPEPNEELLLFNEPKTLNNDTV